MRFILTISLFLAAITASATTLVMGGTDGNNAFPFSEYDSAGRYQQFYNGLPSGFVINSIAFRSLDDHQSYAPFNISATIKIGDMASPLSLDPNQNVSGGGMTVYSGSQLFTPGAARDGNGFDLVFNFSSPFTVVHPENPLVIDVVINASVQGGVAFAAGTNDPSSYRLYQSFGVGSFVLDGQSLQTEFNSVPEPSTFTFVAAAFVAAGLFQRKRG